MTRRASRRQRAVVLVVNVALVAVSGLLAWMVYQNLFVRRPLPPAPHAVTLPHPARLAEIQEQRKSPLALPSVVDSIATRNLFSPTRTEATTATAAPPPPPPAPMPTLHRVLVDGAASRAYLEDPTTLMSKAPRRTVGPNGPQCPMSREASMRRLLPSFAPTAFIIIAALMVMTPSLAPAQGTESEDTIAIEGVGSDLFTGAATAQIRVVAPAGAAGMAPVAVLRYDSRTVDELGVRTQGQSAGLGWTLDVGGHITRDTKNTLTTSDDTFKLFLGGRSHDLALVDGAQGLYRTEDDILAHLQYDASSDYWTLITKDGTRHPFGSSSTTRAMTLGPDLTTAITAKYLLDEVTTTSGVAIRYSYVKESATVSSTGRSYDQAVYPDTISYAYSGPSAIGALREIRFVRGARTDWTDSSTPTTLAFFERSRIDAIEVRVGPSLVRKYALGYDYTSIDRDPTYTWGAGAAGDLALTSVTLYGSDGASGLPPLTFAYSNARLASATTGLGGSLSFTYERVNTNPVYAACLNPTWEYSCTELWCWPIRIIGCADWGASNGPDPWGMSGLAGWGCATSRSDTTPIYAACRTPSYEYYCSELGGCYPVVVNGCADFGASNSPDPWGYSTLLGHAYASEVPGTLPLYSACLQGSGGTCSQWALQNSPDSLGMSTLLGYAYRGPVDRYRVISRTASDGRGGSISTTFAYWGLGLSSDGTEFRGHAGARVTDSAGNYTDTWFKQDDALKGRAYQAETRTAAGALLAKTVHTWTVVNPYPSTPSVTLALLAQTDAYACDGGPSCRQSQSVFTYDSHGNPTRANHLGDVVVSGDERDERLEWVVDTANWLHRPSRVAVHDGSGALLREAWISYDGLAWNSLGTRGLATRIESRLAGPLGTSGNPAMSDAHDAYGNRTSATDPRDCTTSTTYDSSKTHPATITNCLGHVTSLEYDARWGAITSATEPNAQTTTSTYDVFGRLIKLTGPLDTGSTYGTVSYSYLDLGNPSAQRVQTSRTEQHGSGNVLWSDRYFDGLGRTYLTRREGPGGQVILSDVTFDNRGLVPAISAAHFSTEPPVWTQFTYDSLGRLTSTRHPDDATATAAYSPGQVTLTDERGSVRRRFLDVWGRLTRVEEVNGAETAVTTYTYDAAGGLGRVTNHLGHQTTMTYDLLGRKVAMQDPNVGNLSYSYDVGGNLLSQTDAKGQTLTFTYDLRGRVLTKRYPGGAEILWTYDDPAVPYSKGRATRGAGLATSSSFTYDPIARVTQVSRLLDGSTYTLGLVYDALGRVASKTFPDGETVTYTYNDAGWLSAIPGYLPGITYNARGQQTQLQFANGVTSTRSYSSSRFWLDTLSTSAPGASHQNLAFTHDPAGNITQITDAVWTGSRTFSYDALNRLISAGGPFGAPAGGIPTQTSETYLYDALRNIPPKAATRSSPARMCLVMKPV